MIVESEYAQASGGFGALHDSVLKQNHVAARVNQLLHDSLGSRGDFQNACFLRFVSPRFCLQSLSFVILRSSPFALRARCRSSSRGVWYVARERAHQLAGACIHLLLEDQWFLEHDSWSNVNRHDEWCGVGLLFPTRDSQSRCHRAFILDCEKSEHCSKSTT